MGTWASVEEVSDIAGATVDEGTLAIAQTMMESFINRIWRETDTESRDYYWLKRTVAFQARHLKEHPEVLNMLDVSSMSEGSISLSLRDDIDSILISPIARMMTFNLWRGMNTTIRLNSAFQKNLRNNRTGASGVAPWRSL